MYAVYEAGRDGFWLARWLGAQGVTCHIIDPCSILVDRKAKQRKNDAIDSRALLDLLVRHGTGDRVMKTVLVPPVEAEDSHELGRLLNSLGSTRRALAARIQSLLWTQGIDASYHTALPTTLDAMRTGDGRPLGTMLRVELDVLCHQVEHLDRDICRLEAERARQIQQPATPTQEKARDLERLVGIGRIGAWTLANEVFGWRTFQNGKKLGAFVGLCPTPWFSGTVDRDQGISKAGSGPLRALRLCLECNAPPQPGIRSVTWTFAGSVPIADPLLRRGRSAREPKVLVGRPVGVDIRRGRDRDLSAKAARLSDTSRPESTRNRLYTDGETAAGPPARSSPEGRGAS